MRVAWADSAVLGCVVAAEKHEREASGEKKTFHGVGVPGIGVFGTGIPVPGVNPLLTWKRNG